MRFRRPNYSGQYTNHTHNTHFSLHTGVLDQIKGGEEYSYIFEKGATVTIDGSCVFEGNTAGNPNTSILNLAPIGATLSESQWKGQTITYTGTD